VSTVSHATGGVSRIRTHLLRSLTTTTRLSLRMRARHWHRRRCGTYRDAVDELDVRRELDVRLWRATGLTVLTGMLDKHVDLGDGEVVVDEVADVMGDHGTPVRAGLVMVVGVGVVRAETLPAEVMAAALAWR
jgi:hypothetical protein